MAEKKSQMNGQGPLGDAEPRAEGNVFHRATAFVLADTHTRYIVHSGIRNAFRAIIVAAVFAAVVTFTVVKYTTDDSLKSATQTQREENIRKLSGDTIEVSLCPCRNETFPWSTFVNYTAPLSSNFTEQVLLCQRTIVPELATTPQPTADSSSAELRTYIRLIETLTANFAVQFGCSLTVQDLLEALDPNPDNHVIGFGNNFYSTELLSEKQARRRLDTLIGNLFIQYQRDFVGQLGLLQLLQQQLQNNLTSVATALQSSNDTTAIDTFSVVQQSFDLYTNITAEALTTTQNTAADPRFVNRLLDTLKNATTLDYDNYLDACAPYYCDFTERKSAWVRLTEFLGLLGGLYTTFLGIGFTVWFILDFWLPSRQ